MKKIEEDNQYLTSISTRILSTMATTTINVLMVHQVAMQSCDAVDTIKTKFDEMDGRRGFKYPIKKRDFERHVENYTPRRFGNYLHSGSDVKNRLAVKLLQKKIQNNPNAPR